MSNGEVTVASGVVACPDGLHTAPTRSSAANHSFGAAAERDGDGNLSVTFYAEVRGRRSAELVYDADAWDNGIVAALRDAGEQGIEQAYGVLDGIIVRDLGHRSLGTIVRFVPDAHDEYERVTIIQEGGDGQKRMVSDSITAFGALLDAAMSKEEPLMSTNLEAVTVRVPANEYFVAA